MMFTIVGVFGSWSSAGLALLLRPGSREGVFKVLLLLPWVVPIVVSSTAMELAGRHPQQPDPQRCSRRSASAEPLFLADPTWAAILVCVFKVWISFPFMMMMTSAALASGGRDRLRGGPDGRRQPVAAVRLDHPADDRPVHLHLAGSS